MRELIIHRYVPHAAIGSGNRRPVFSPLIGALLPAAVATIETRVDVAVPALFVDEERCVARAVASRRREFQTGRACARRALAQLGVAPVAILAGPAGEPLWPVGVAGSITHCRGYRACAVARVDEIAAIGIDAEPHAPLPHGVLEAISSPAERGALAAAGAGAAWLDRVLFCAKEAVFKAWFGLTGARLRFEDAEVSIDAARGTFRARAGRGAPGRLHGRWRIADGLVLAATVVPQDTAVAPA